MIGNFFGDLIILKKNYKTDNISDNPFFKIKGNNIILFQNAYGLKNKNIITLKKGIYNLDEFEKIIITDKLIKEKFLNDLFYDNKKFILLEKLNLSYQCKNFNTEYSSFKKAEEYFKSFISNEMLCLVFNELFFNAYEHGNLSLNFEEKENLIKQNKYHQFLKTHKNKKLIEVCIAKKNNYIFVRITDEGKGFKQQKKNIQMNGRGIKIAEKYAYLFYNQKGNSILFIGKNDEL